MNPLVSICIPTYRQTFLLKEDLDSICRQTYKNFEVLVSDDSPDDAVRQLVETYKDLLPINYVKNTPSLGSPANWNAVLKRAGGDFVLLLHHDDKFASDGALARFLQGFTSASVDFAFGRNTSIDQMVGARPHSPTYFNRYYKDPSLLIRVNTLGPPSNVMLKRKAVQFYDERFKWIVDIEYYARLFKAGKAFAYIDEHLIKTGTHEGQITNQCINDSAILLFENVTFAVENIRRPKHIAVFDFYWRLLRNNNVRSEEDLAAAGINTAKLPAFIRTIIQKQAKLPPKALTVGSVSKSLMTLTYLSVK